MLVGTAMSADLSCPQDPLPDSRFWQRGREGGGAQQRQNKSGVEIYTHPKTNMDTQYDVLAKVTPSKYGHVLGYLSLKFLVGVT